MRGVFLWLLKGISMGSIPFGTVAHNYHGKIQFNTAKYNASRQNTIRNDKFKLLTANYKHSRQKQKQLLQFRKFIKARAKRSRQEQDTHGNSKTVTAKAKRSRQNQIKKSGQRLSKYVV